MRHRLLDRTERVALRTPLGEFWMHGYAIAHGERVETHLAVGYGVLADPVPVRINSACVTSEVFGDVRCDCAWQLEEAMRRFTERGHGVLTYHPAHEGRGIGLMQKIRSYQLMDERSLTTGEAFAALGEPPDARSYLPAVTILQDLGVREVELLSNNPDKMAVVEAAGISIVGAERIVAGHNPRWHDYLRSKATSFGHLIELAPTPEA